MEPEEDNTSDVGTVIIGAGHAGVECAYALRAAGYAESIAIFSAESCEPYQRPPLSKAFLSGAMAVERLALRSAQAYEKQAIQIVTGDPVVQLDAVSRRAITAAGREVAFRYCVIATGARARGLPTLEGQDLYSIRTLADALELRTCLQAGRRLLVVGGGYLGLEVAATAAKAGAQVVVFEHSPALMSGKVSDHTSTEFEAMHRQSGIKVFRDAMIVHWDKLEKGWRAHLADGSAHEGDAVLVSVGATPNCELAIDAGIECDGGVVVDEHFRSSIPHVFAIGDCASSYREELAGRARVESVQNALDSARIAAAAIAGADRPARRPATFWSEQHGRRLQIAGMIDPSAPSRDLVVTTNTGWMVERYQHGLLACVEALDSPVEFMKAMKRLGSVEPPGEATSPKKEEPINANS